MTWLVYDGQCPFCSGFARLTRLRQSVGPVVLVDARKGGNIVDAITAAKLDLDEGMVLVYNGTYYHGDDCLHMLAMLSTESTIINRIFAKLFRSPLFCRRYYPLLRIGRNTILNLTGKSKIRNLDSRQ